MAKQQGSYYSGVAFNFSETLHNWARQANAQFHDAYKTQKMWNGSKENEVWSNRGKRTVRIRADRHISRKIDKEYTVSSYGWSDEVTRRILMQQKNPSRDYWYSTGTSYQIAMHNPVTVVNDTRDHGEIDFHTTMGVLYAEAGVGATGKHFVRGSKGSKGRSVIKVDRAKAYHHDVRYVGDWVPMQGKTHRPNTRQQVNLFARRLKWASRLIFQDKLTAWIAYTIDANWKNLGDMVWGFDSSGMLRGISFDNKGGMYISSKSFEEYMKSGDK